MHILCLGISHSTAPIQLRERVAFSEEQVRTALFQLVAGHARHVEAEMVIISTCNRIELYATGTQLSFAELEAFLSEARGIPIAELHGHLYRLADTEAVHHLMNVAGGLDSLVLGEPQILGQVTRALELARGLGAAGPLLTRLFQAAVHAGKRVRTETAISRNPASVPSIAASLCTRSMADIRAARVIIVGAGEMAELAIESLRKRGVARLVVINRTLDNAHLLARRWNAEVQPFENLEHALADADILISSTRAPRAIIHAPMVAAAMHRRPERPLMLIDIAVPRDIDPEVAQIPNLRLHDIDNLNAHLEQSLAERAAEIPHVRAILATEEAKFLEFIRTLDMLPLITDLHQQAEAIRHAELQKTLQSLPDLTEAERRHIEALSQALVKKLLANPTNHLRAEARSPRAPEIASLARTLFNLQNKQGAHNFSRDAAPDTSAAD